MFKPKQMMRGITSLSVAAAVTAIFISQLAFAGKDEAESDLLPPAPPPITRPVTNQVEPQTAGANVRGMNRQTSAEQELNSPTSAVRHPEAPSEEKQDEKSVSAPSTQTKKPKPIPRTQVSRAQSQGTSNLSTEFLTHLKVLVTDDNPIDQKVVVRHLTRLGVPPQNIDTAEDGQIAVDKVRAGGRFGFITSDYNMPNKEGGPSVAEITQILQDRRAQQKAHGIEVEPMPYIIGVSGQTDPTERQRVINEFKAGGADNYYDKPAKPANIEESLKAAQLKWQERQQNPIRTAPAAGTSACLSATAGQTQVQTAVSTATTVRAAVSGLARHASAPEESTEINEAQ